MIFEGSSLGLTILFKFSPTFEDLTATHSRMELH